MPPVSLLILTVLVVLCICLDKKSLFIPFIIVAVTLGINVAIDIGPLTFYAPRVLVTVAIIRMIVKKEFCELNSLDRIVVAFGLIDFFIYILRELTFSAFTYKGGTTFDSLGLYLIFTMSFRENNSIEKIPTVLAIVAIPLTIILIYEKITRYNLLSILWGTPTYAIVRDGTVRATGPFRHPILTGTFGATSFSIVLSMWFLNPNKRLLTIIGLSCCTIITIVPGTSGGLMAYLFCCIGIGFWFYRTKMKTVRRMLVFLLVVCQCCMSSPIWYLLAKIAEITGGTGWHRSKLFDSFVNRYQEWVLIGTSYTHDWVPFSSVALADPRHTDITNYFIAQGISSGIIGLILFIKILVRAYSNVGKSQSVLSYEQNPKAFLYWTFGVSLLGHTASFFSVTYFGPILIFWSLLLAMISTLEPICDSKNPLC